MIDLASPLLNQYGLLGILVIHFLSYSIIPFPSETAMIGATLFLNPYSILIFALIGSTLGVITSYYIGLKGVKRFLPKKNSKQYKKANKIFSKYGELSILLFGWVPIIGDPLTILAGSFEMEFKKFIIYSTIGRFAYFCGIIMFGISLEAIF